MYTYINPLLNIGIRHRMSIVNYLGEQKWLCTRVTHELCLLVTNLLNVRIIFVLPGAMG